MSILAIALTISFLFFTKNPFFPLLINSDAAPRLYEITGVPHAMDSTMTMPKGSSHAIGFKNAFAAPISLFFAFTSSGPR